MPRSPSEQALIERFSRTYGHLTSSETMMEIERSVCGCDYGCTSWTTRKEADGVAGMLRLRPGVKFLEVGAGSGWPGLYLAKETGCDATLIDLPLEGLKAARERAETDGLADRCQIIQGDGAALPFGNGSFDAIYHSDVLCCLVEKLAVLESCRRVIRDEGKMVFSVILIQPGLSEADNEIAAAGGPTFIETDVPYPEMLEKTGWDITDHGDQTADYTATFRKFFSLEQDNIDEFERVHGPEGAVELIGRRERTLDALDQGLLRREIFTVVGVG
ncbi:MAG: class I SAM-dependent methyltransferase [Rhodospirillales bacterium]